MKIKDQVIVAFLVSVGVFSVAQATQYVSTLSNKEKKILLPAAKMSTKNMLLCDAQPDPLEFQVTEKKS